MEKYITFQEEYEDLALLLLRRYAAEFEFTASTKDGEIYKAVFKSEQVYLSFNLEWQKFNIK